jgi:FkbM family methyltransferase
MMSLESSEPSVKAILDQRHHGDVVDVGANLGFYSVILSHTVDKKDKVVSVEPDPVYYPYLLRNLSLNGCTNVIPVQAACWSSETRLNVVRPTVGMALDTHVEESEGFPEVSATRLDSILKEQGCHPVLVKVDVEGSEVEVLRGMKDTMARDRPVIVFEARAKTIGACREVLLNKRYKIKLLKDGNYLAEPID